VLLCKESYIVQNFHYVILHILRLTLSVRVEYEYSAASHTSCLDGVLVPHNFHKVLK
jgi:hypothetical protein